MANEVFTTILVINGRPLYFKEHLERLHKHAKLAGVVMPAEAGIQSMSSTILDASLRWHDKRLLRVSLSSRGYRINTRPYSPPPLQAYKQGVQVYITNQIACSELKLSNRKVYNEAYRQAQAQGAFEGLLLSPDGYVVDGSRSSPFLKQDNKIISLQGGIDGVTRQKFLEFAKKQGHKIQEAYLKPSELVGELFIAGTGMGVLRAFVKSNVTLAQARV
ncbi:MAG: aminotransferase class IV [Deltaproteobacteria bacterium]|nr:aminotransferase class IV [Deltaproteobacteria bacterium]